jgi:hypothetical protein
VLLIANRVGCLKLGSVSLDGTKIHANASKHSALSYEYACKLEEKLREEVGKLMKMAEEADNTAIPDGLDIPKELSRREERMAVILAAKEEIERRALERFEEEKHEYAEKIAVRAKREEETGKKSRGKAPVDPVNSDPAAKDQVNLTDADSRIMHESGGAFEQSYNAQASVDGETQIIVTSDVTQHTNDKEELVPTLESLEALPAELGKVKKILADAGYYSEANINACEDAEITPFIAPGRMPHSQSFLEGRAEPEPETEKPSTAVERMKRRLKTKEGRKIFSRRKCTIEPVFGIIKHVMGFRQFLLRGINRYAENGVWYVCHGI